MDATGQTAAVTNAFLQQKLPRLFAIYNPDSPGFAIGMAFAALVRGPALSFTTKNVGDMVLSITRFAANKCSSIQRRRIKPNCSSGGPASSTVSTSL